VKPWASAHSAFLIFGKHHFCNLFNLKENLLVNNVVTCRSSATQSGGTDEEVPRVAHRGNVGGLGAHLPAQAGGSLSYAAGCAGPPVDEAGGRAFPFHLTSIALSTR